MNERALQFRIGVVVVAAVIIAIIVLMLFGEGKSLFRRHIRVTIRFPEAPGVMVDTPVRKSGVLIGRVTDVDLLDTGEIDVTMQLEADKPIRVREFCRIGTGSLVTGDAVLEFVPVGDEQLTAAFDEDRDGVLSERERRATKEFYSDGSIWTQNGFVQVDPLEAFAELAREMPPAIKSVEQAGYEIAQIANRLNRAVINNESDLKNIIKKASQSLDQFHATMATINEVVGDQEIRDGLKNALRGVPTLFNEAEKTLVQVQGTMGTFQSVGERAERNLENIEGITQPLAERGDELVGSIESTLNNVNSLVAELDAFSQKLNSQDGTLSRLMTDEELYDTVLQTTKNVENLTRRLEPILNDVRVAADKVARDPSVVIRGAISGKPAGAGLKTGIR